MIKCQGIYQYHTHELRTPVQPILGLSEILQSKVKDKEQLILLDVISRNARGYKISQKTYLMLQKLKVITKN